MHLVRFNCVYTSVVPKSVFIQKGTLYEVTPIGNTHVTLAYYIDQINNIISSTSYSPFHLHHSSSEIEAETFKMNAVYLYGFFNKYWQTNVSIDRFYSVISEQIQNIKADKKWIEVLCDKVRVVRVVEDTIDLFKVGDTVVTTNDIKFTYYGYDATGAKQVSPEVEAKIRDTFNLPGDSHFLSMPKGTKCIITRLNYRLPNPSIGQLYAGDTISTNSHRAAYIDLQPIGYDFKFSHYPEQGKQPGIKKI